MSTTENPFFERYNALIDRGWLAALKPVEVFVWLSYLRHMNTTTLAWPSPRKIAAEYLGHASGSHIRRARSRLCVLGLLSRSDQNEGGRTAGKFFVNIPPLREIVPSAESALAPNRRNHLARNRSGVPSAESAHHPTPNRRTEGLIEQTTQQPNQQQQDVVDVGGGSFEDEDEEDRIQDLRDALRELSIHEPTRSQLIEEIPGLTADDVNEIADSLPDSAGTGMIVNALRSDGTQQIEARTQREAMDEANRAAFFDSHLKKRKEVEAPNHHNHAKFLKTLEVVQKSGELMPLAQRWLDQNKIGPVREDDPVEAVEYMASIIWLNENPSGPANLTAGLKLPKVATGGARSKPGEFAEALSQ